MAATEQAEIGARIFRRIKKTWNTMVTSNRQAEAQAEIDIGGKIYTINSDDDYLDHIRPGFEPQMVGLFRSLATGSELILDVGANIGCTAILFGPLAKKVIAFEPSPSTFAFLKQNIAQSGLTNLFPQNLGLGCDAGEFNLTFSPKNRSGGFVSSPTQTTDGHTVEKIKILSLDDFAQQNQLSSIDFIKIDVEGFEGHVIRGGKRTLAENRPIVVLELNHWCLNAFQRTSVPDFLDLLRETFPILVAVDGSTYLDLHDKNEAYAVMYHHIIHMRYLNIVAAFDEAKLSRFRKEYRHQRAY